MVETINTGRLYGVITPILQNGKFVKCEPVFIDDMLYKNPSAFYLGEKQVFHPRMGISHFKKIDIRQYGKPVFLPANHKMINDGKTHFVMFQPTKDHTKICLQSYYRFPEISVTTPNSWYSAIINVGILFPNKFVSMIADREISEEELFLAIDK